MLPFADIWALLRRLVSKTVLVNGLFVFMIFGGAALYLFSFGLPADDGESFRLLGKLLSHKQVQLGVREISATLLNTGIISVFITTFTYMGVFREALRKELEAQLPRFRSTIAKIIYGREHLEARIDIEEIWSAATEALCRSSFPALAKSLNSTILASLLPISRDFYYADYHRECTFSWADENKTLVRLRDEINLKIVPVTADQKIVYRYKSKTDSRTPAEQARITLTKLRINNAHYEKELKEETYSESLPNGTTVQGLLQHYDIDLSGAECYRVERVIERFIAIDRDPVLDCRSPHFIAGPTSLKAVSLAPDLDVQFIDCVTTDFDDSTSPTDTRWTLERDYNGLIFPNQGYALTVHRRFIQT